MVDRMNRDGWLGPKTEAEHGNRLAPILFSLTEDERYRLIEQIGVSDGRIIVLVHPYMVDGNLGYRQGLDKLVAGGYNGWPLLIFESAGQGFDQIRQGVARRQNSDMGRVTYFVPTELSNPRPIVDWQPGQKIVIGDRPGREESWRKLVELLDGLGVKECIVGGTYADESGVSDPDEGTTRPCVNTTLNELSRKFRVELSEVAYPCNRSSLKRDGARVSSPANN